MEFEWDETKNRTNILKHGIDFETAMRIFDGAVLCDATAAGIMARTATSPSDAWAKRRWSSLPTRSAAGASV